MHEHALTAVRTKRTAKSHYCAIAHIDSAHKETTVAASQTLVSTALVWFAAYSFYSCPARSVQCVCTALLSAADKSQQL